MIFQATTSDSSEFDIYVALAVLNGIIFLIEVFLVVHNTKTAQRHHIVPEKPANVSSIPLSQRTPESSFSTPLRRESKESTPKFSHIEKKFSQKGLSIRTVPEEDTPGVIPNFEKNIEVLSIIETTSMGMKHTGSADSYKQQHNILNEFVKIQMKEQVVMEITNDDSPGVVGKDGNKKVEFKVEKIEDKNPVRNRTLTFGTSGNTKEQGKAKRI
jgi:hypothetical protein